MPNPTLSGPPAATLMLQCAASKLALTDVLVRGSRVRITGIANLNLAGQKAKIFLAGAKKPLATVAVSVNGMLSATGPAPAASARLRARYTVQIGTLHSAALALTRRLILNPPSYAAGKVTISGQVVAPLAKSPAKVVIQQRVTCGNLITVATVKPSSNGSFHTTLLAPAGQAAVYGAMTQVLKSANRTAKTTAQGLAQVVTLG